MLILIDISLAARQGQICGHHAIIIIVLFAVPVVNRNLFLLEAGQAHVFRLESEVKCHD